MSNVFVSSPIECVNPMQRVILLADVSPQNGDEEPPAKLAKLAIVEEREEDKYDHVTALRCWDCKPEGNLIPLSSHPKVCILDMCKVDK